MSRWLEEDRNGVYHEEVNSMDECKYLINEVCCNDKSEQCCDFPHPEEYCAKRCPHFTKEYGIIRN